MGKIRDLLEVRVERLRSRAERLRERLADFPQLSRAWSRVEEHLDGYQAVCIAVARGAVRDAEAGAELELRLRAHVEALKAALDELEAAAHALEHGEDPP